MRVELNVPEAVREARMGVTQRPVLAMALRSGSFELGLRRSEMIRLPYDAGEMSLVPRHFEKWFRTDDLHYLSVGISDAALTAAADGTSGEVEVRRADNLADARLRALVEAVNAGRIAGVPSGRLFLHSCELALAVALVNGYAVRHRSVQTHRGGAGFSPLWKIKKVVDAEIGNQVTL